MEQFAELIKEGASIVGIESARLWPQFVALHWLKGIVSLFMFLLALMACLFVFIKSYQKSDFEAFEPCAIHMALVLSCVFLLVFITVGITEFSNLVGQIFYPEADLVQRMIKNGF